MPYRRLSLSLSRSSFSLSSRTSASAQHPPTYTPAPDAPAYAPEPSADERRLEISARALRLTRPDSTIARKVSHAVSVVFFGQPEGRTTPECTQIRGLKGEVCVQDPEGVASVELELRGRLELTHTEGGSASFKLFSQRNTLWKRTSQRLHGSTELDQEEATCPPRLEFDLPLPGVFSDGSGANLNLPPSYAVLFAGVPGLSASCVYTLVVSVESRRGFVPWKKRKSSVVPLDYRLRMRPPQPLIPRHYTFLSTLKTAPESWFQIISTMPSRRNQSIQPIECLLFVPSVRIFAFTDTIPFHLQLRAPTTSLRAFLYPTFVPTSTKKPNQTPPHAASTNTSPTVRVFLYRQIIVEVRGQRVWRYCVLGEGKLRAVPPGAGPGVDSEASSADGSTLDWEGEVRCDPGGEFAKVSGFNAGKLVVKDFIVVNLVPPCPQYSPLLEHQHAYPIKLTTDPYLEVVDNDQLLS